MEKVSIIIPSYNHGRYILEAVNSALTQDYPDKEVLVVDDGSTDNTRSLLSPFIETGRIKYYFQGNAGLPAARNTGVRFCKGDVLKFLDSDDLIYPLQISSQLYDMQTNGADLVYGDYEVLYYDQAARLVQTEKYRDLSSLAYFIKHNPAPVHAYLVRKKAVVEAGGFDESLKAMEDWDLWLRLILKGAKVFKGTYVGCVYRIFKDSMSSNEQRMFTQKCRVLEKLSSYFLEDKARFSDQEKNLLLEQDLDLVLRCILKGQNPSHLLPLALRTTGSLLEFCHSGLLNRAFVKLLGLSAVLRLFLAKKYLFDRRSFEKIKYPENWWRQSPSEAAARPLYRWWSHGRTKENKGTLHQHFRMFVRR